jgi:hypothetical protein
MKTWIQELADHHEASRKAYPYDKLLVLFDIDGTILDSRNFIHHALQTFDAKHNTEYFKATGVDDIDFHEDDVGRITKRLGLPDHHSTLINNTFYELLRASATYPETYCPFDGVLEVIGLLQNLSNTYAALNTARPETLRFCTLQNLNRLGRAHDARFADELLFMQPDAWPESIRTLKCRGVEYFKARGYRVIAFLDNEPENLHAVSEMDPERDILLLHADTLFKSSPSMLPGQAVSGSVYDTTHFRLHGFSTNRVEYAWRCNFERKAFSQFIGSNIGWLQMDLKYLFDPLQGMAVPRSDRFLPSQIFSYAQKNGKGIKTNIHIEYGSYLVLKVLETIDRLGMDPSLKRYCIGPEELRAGCFSWLRDMYPSSIIEFSIDHLVNAVIKESRKTKGFLEMLNGLGIRRFSIKWRNDGLQRDVVSLLHEWGFELHVDNVGDFRDFLQAAALAPCSLTVSPSSDDWKYFDCTGREDYFEGPSLKRIA